MLNLLKYKKIIYNTDYNFKTYACLDHRSNLKLCPNCREFVSILSSGIFNLCGKSDTHTRIRGSSKTSEENKKSFTSALLIP